MRAPGVAGLLLTGGASRRMGVDKASMVIDGQPLARRLGALLSAHVDRALEVGPGLSGLPAVREAPAGGGPLAAVAAGASHLAADSQPPPTVVLSCDLPRLNEAGVEFLAGWPGHGAVVPLFAERPQPLCARWAGSDLGAALAAVAAGRRALRGLPELAGATVVGEEAWVEALGPHAFCDADTKDDLRALGLGLAGLRYQARRSG